MVTGFIMLASFIIAPGILSKLMSPILSLSFGLKSLKLLSMFILRSGWEFLGLLYLGDGMVFGGSISYLCAGGGWVSLLSGVLYGGGPWLSNGYLYWLSAGSVC